VAKIDADLLENRIGVVLHQREAFLAQDFVVRDLARNVRDRRSRASRPRSPLRVAAAGTARVTGLCVLFVHRHLPISTCPILALWRSGSRDENLSMVPVDGGGW